MLSRAGLQPQRRLTRWRANAAAHRSRVPDGNSAEQLRVAMLPVLTGLPVLARQTLTWDQGSEMACHHLLDEYFTDASSLLRRLARGCAERTRTPTGSSASTSPRAATCAPSPSPICKRSRTASTAGPASDLLGVAQLTSWRPNWQGELVSVATTKRIRRYVRCFRGRDLVLALGHPSPRAIPYGASPVLEPVRSDS